MSGQPTRTTSAPPVVCAADATFRLASRSHTARAVMLVLSRLHQQWQRRALQLALATATLHRAGVPARNRRDPHLGRSHRVYRAQLALHRCTQRQGRPGDISRGARAGVESVRGSPAGRFSGHRGVERRGANRQ